MKFLLSVLRTRRMTPLTFLSLVQVPCFGTRYLKFIHTSTPFLLPSKSVLNREGGKNPMGSLEVSLEEGLL